MNKYHNQPVMIDGIRFASRREGERYRQLLLMQKAGVIEGLRLQVPYTLIAKSSHGRAIRYIADFVYFDRERKRPVIEDVKGVRTDVYKLKKRLMAELGYEIAEV